MFYSDIKTAKALGPERQLLGCDVAGAAHSAEIHFCSSRINSIARARMFIILYCIIHVYIII